MEKKVFIVEDNEDVRMLYRHILRKSRIKVVGEAESAEEALMKIPETSPNLIVVDISLPGMDGLELIKELRKMDSFFCILVCTAHEVGIYKDSAMKAGADAVLSKGDAFTLPEIIHCLYDEKKCS